MNAPTFRILTISSMYPSKTHPTFGIFVSKFEEAIVRENFVVSERAVISGQGRSVLSKTFKYLVFFAEIIVKVLKNRYDVVYVHYISNSSPVLFFLRRFIKKRFIINFHGGDLLLINGLERFTASITRSLIQSADLLVVPSDYFKEEVTSRFQIEDEKIYIYPSGGVDTDDFRPMDRKALRHKFQLSDFWVIGMVARIDKGKRWDIFLKAISLLGATAPWIKCKALVVGTGKEEPAFLELIERLNISDRVVFLGEKDHQYLPEIYNLMNIFVFATENESLGLVGLEAMACGTPIIAPLVGGIRGYLSDGVNGLSLSALDEHDVVDKLILFYQLEPEAQEAIIQKRWSIN